MSSLLIRRFGRMIDISPDGRSPLDPRLVASLVPHLSYQKRIFVRGHQQYAPDGTRGNSVEIENRRMYAIEEGRLTTSYGFYHKIVTLLHQWGFALGYVDMSPPPERPHRFVEHWDRVNQHVTWRHEVQRYCLQQMARHDQGQILAPAGFGKTFILEALCHLYPFAKIHIAVRPIEVAQRIYRQLSRSLPNVGMIGGGNSCEGERITIFTAGSLHHSDGDCDVFVGDEAHQLLAENAAQEIGRAYRFCKVFLMTWTPEGRSDGCDVRMEMLGGPPIFQLTYPQGVECGLVVPIKVRWLLIDLPSNPAAGKKGTPRERWGVWRNDGRNALIAADARANYGPETQVLMLCSKVEHAIHLWQHLPEYSLCYAEQEPGEIAEYKKNHYLPEGFAEITPARREMLRETFEAGSLKKVIATDVWATGVDFPQLQVFYRTDARTSKIVDGQAPARTSRIFEGKEYGEVVDCCDRFDDTLYDGSLTRRRHYKDFGWEQQWPHRNRRTHAL